MADTIVNADVFERTPPTKHQKYYLAGDRRLGEVDVAVVEAESPQDDRYVLDGQNYNGLLWRESNGTVWEAEVLDGQLCRDIEFRFDGSCEAENLYQDGRIVDSWHWDKSGRVTSRSVLLADVETASPSSNGIATYRLEGGRVVSEVFDRRTRLFHRTGQVLLERRGELTSIFDDDGHLVLKVDRTGVLHADEQRLNSCWPRLLWRRQVFVERPFFTWLKSVIDEEAPGAVETVMGLLNHDVAAHVEEAIVIVKNRRLHQAAEKLSALTATTLCKRRDEGGYVGTTAQIAEHALLRLATADDDDYEHKRAELHRKHKEDNQAAQLVEKAEQALVAASWPLATAEYHTTHKMSSTIRSGSQILDELGSGSSSDPVTLEQWYIHEYRFRVNDYEFVSNHDAGSESQPSADRHIVRVRYDPSSPGHNAIVL